MENMRTAASETPTASLLQYPLSRLDTSHLLDGAGLDTCAELTGLPHRQPAIQRDGLSREFRRPTLWRLSVQTAKPAVRWRRLVGRQFASPTRYVPPSPPVSRLRLLHRFRNKYRCLV